ncbi:MAG: hypothetical protein JO287_03105 [Pseudonocardiales bacterium]|nr:hypothetical protein [Pseudonocardiales bacterium]
MSALVICLVVGVFVAGGGVVGCGCGQGMVEPSVGAALISGLCRRLRQLFFDAVFWAAFCTAEAAFVAADAAAATNFLVNSR